MARESPKARVREGVFAVLYCDDASSAFELPFEATDVIEDFLLGGSAASVLVLVFECESL